MLQGNGIQNCFGRASSETMNVGLEAALGAGFGTGTVCAVESVATPATETATIKANAARAPASVNGSASRNFAILVNAKSWFVSRAIVRQGYCYSVKTSVRHRYRPVLFESYLTCWPSAEAG